MAETTFIRAKKDRDYTTINNCFLRDERLSAAAKGVFAYILYLPEDWVIYQSELSKHFSNGRDSIRHIIAELEKFGYITKEEVRNKTTGRYSGYSYRVIEVPEREDRDGKSATDNPKSENSTLPNTNNNQILNKPNSADAGEFEKLFPSQKKKSFKRNDYTECVSLISSIQNTLKNKGYDIDSTQYPIPVLNKWLKTWFEIYGVEETKKGIKNSMSFKWLVVDTKYSLSALFSDKTFPKCVSNSGTSNLTVQKGKSAFEDKPRDYSETENGGDWV